MYLIVGLGNPERKYDGTRHNVGFEAIDAISKKFGIDVISSFFIIYCCYCFITGLTLIPVLRL